MDSVHEGRETIFSLGAHAKVQSLPAPPTISAGTAGIRPDRSFPHHDWGKLLDDLGRDARDAARKRRRVQAVLGRPDRKSTRLNSSHLVISYAVFGLKKKNRKRRKIA